MRGRHAAVPRVPCRKDRRVVAAMVLAGSWSCCSWSSRSPGDRRPERALGRRSRWSRTRRRRDHHRRSSTARSSRRPRAQGLQEVPEPSDPQYAASRRGDVRPDPERWIRGEAAERGITVSDSEVTNQLEQIKEQNFGDQEEFQQFLKQARLHAEEDAREGRARGCSATQLQAAGDPRGRRASRTPRSRTSTRPTRRSSSSPRRATCAGSSTRTRRKVEQAKALLEQDDSPASWEKVAAQFSTDDGDQGQRRPAEG